MRRTCAQEGTSDAMNSMTRIGQAALGLGLAAAVGILGSCDRSPGSAQASPQARARAKAVEPVRYTGPAVQAQRVLNKPYRDRYVANVTVSAPTSGYKLALDGCDVSDRVAKVYFTLEKPGSSDNVANIVVPLHEQFETLTPYDKAELYVNLTERGGAAAKPSYRLASTLR
jgi:hypothetical protein